MAAAVFGASFFLGAFDGGGALAGAVLPAGIDYGRGKVGTQLHQGRQQVVHQAELGHERKAGEQRDRGLPLLLQGGDEARQRVMPRQFGQIRAPGAVRQQQLQGRAGLQAQHAEVPRRLVAQADHHAFRARRTGILQDEAGQGHGDSVTRRCLGAVGGGLGARVRPSVLGPET